MLFFFFQKIPTALRTRRKDRLEKGQNSAIAASRATQYINHGFAVTETSVDQ